MPKNPKYQDNLVKLFVAASIFLLVVFMLIFFVIYLEVMNGQTKDVEDGAAKPESGENRYYLKDANVQTDPFMTKVPKLNDMLKGPIISSSDPSYGNINSPVVMVIFSDFECSYCAKQEKILKEVAKEYDARLIWKDYPSSDQDSKSFQAALAARCAQKENAFWSFHDLLYSGQYNLDKEGLRNLASKLNLDMDDFNKCMQTKETASLVGDNMNEAGALDINGIPFLYVNDQEIMGEISKDELKKIIETQIGKKR